MPLCPRRTPCELHGRPSVTVFGVGLAKQPDIPLQCAEAQGFTLLLPKEVEDAEGLDREQEGEDVTGEKRPREPSNKDITTRWKWVPEKCATQIPFTLSQCGVPTLETCCELWTVMCAREKCASARVQVGVVSTHPSRLTAVATDWVWNSDSATSGEKNRMRTRLREDFLVGGDNVELVVFRRSASVSWMLVRLLGKREFEVVSLTIVLTICRPANCAGAISAKSESMKTSSDVLSSVTSWKRRMAEDVLLRTVLSNLLPAIPGIPAVKDQSCYVSVFFHFFG